MPNHPNRGPKGPASNPNPAEVRALRAHVQSALGLGITAAQDWCAEKLFTSRRTFQQWETDASDLRNHRRMHPAFFALLQIRIGEIK